MVISIAIWPTFLWMENVSAAEDVQQQGHLVRQWGIHMYSDTYIGVCVLNTTLIVALVKSGHTNRTLTCVWGVTSAQIRPHSPLG